MRHSRWMAALELALFALVLFGHDVFRWRAVPIGEVIPFFVIGWISLRLRGLGWRDLGLRRPRRWLPTFGIALLIGIALQATSTYVTEPLMLRLFHQRPDLSEFQALVGNVKLALLALLMIWTLAAFGEELVFRGYLLNRLEDLAGSRLFAVAASVVLFAFGHFYQGPAGVVDSGVTGLVLAVAYVASGNLWLPILAHGLTDTIGLLLVVTGHMPSSH